MFLCLSVLHEHISSLNRVQMSSTGPKYKHEITKSVITTNIFSPFDPIIGLLDLELVQLDTNFIKIG